MGLPWIAVHTNLPGHPKSIALGVALKDKRAWTHMVQLWLWAGDHCMTGKLSARNGEILIEHAAGWEGAQGAFCAAALDAGFLEKDPDGSIVIHDWDVTNGAHVTKRARDAERQKERRLRLVQGGSLDVQQPSNGRPRDVRVTSKDRPRESQGDIERETDIDKDHSNHHHPSENPDAEEKPHPLSEDLRAVWNGEKAPEMPEWRPSRSRKRRETISARLKERPNLEEWREVIRRLARSNFARGLVPGGDGRRWLATPTFLLRPESAEKVLEGIYDNRGSQPTQSTEEPGCLILS